jgi:hypothetical protein
VESSRYRKQKGRGAKYDHIKTIYTTQEMVDEGVRIKRTDSRVENNFAIPVAAPLNLPIAQLPFDPYSLGVWLGDGNSHEPAITCDDQDNEIIENFAYPTKERKRGMKEGVPLNCGSYSFCGDEYGQVKALFEDLGVLNNKHIPEQYLMSSEVQRLFLLQGLMDTDGTVSKSGHCEYCGVNERLVRDVWRLVISLGIKATIIEGDAKLNGEVVGRKYRVCFTTDKPVFKLKRKLDRLYGQKKKDTNKRFIVSIEETESEPMRCISVEAEDHLYLAGEALISTHNSYLSLFSILYEASVPNSKVFYVTLSYRSAKQILWGELKSFLSNTNWIQSINEADLHIVLKNGSQISLRGSDNPDSLRGVGLTSVVLDECAFMTKKTWTEVLRPSLSDTGGSALFISSPAGRNFFYDLWKLGKDGEPGWESFQYTTLDGGNVPAEEIEAAKRDLDEKTFKQEYMATFESYSGVVYYNFHSDQSVKSKSYIKGRQVLIGLDFNTDPMSAVILQKDHDLLYAIDEIVIYSSNTDEISDEIRYRYPVNDVVIYPDPSAVQRKTSAGGKTDVSILQNAGFRVRHRTAHPAIRDRINAVNSRLLSSDGKRHLFVDPKCKTLIESLQKQTYKEGTSIPDKQHGFDHACFGGDVKVMTQDGDIAFKDLPSSGKVKTWNNKWVRYIHAGQTGVKPTMSIKLRSGRTIVTTLDHQWLTIHGWALAEDLRIGEMLCKPNPTYSFPKPSEITAKNDMDLLLEDLPYSVKMRMAHDIVVDKWMNTGKEPVYCMYVPRYHNFQLAGGVTVSNCDALGYCIEYLFPIRRSGKPISAIRLGGL